MNTKSDFKLMVTTGVFYFFIVSSGLQLGAAFYESFVIVRGRAYRFGDNVG